MYFAFTFADRYVINKFSEILYLPGFTLIYYDELTLLLLLYYKMEIKEEEKEDEMEEEEVKVEEKKEVKVKKEEEPRERESDTLPPEELHDINTDDHPIKQEEKEGSSTLATEVSGVVNHLVGEGGRLEPLFTTIYVTSKILQLI